MNNIFSIKTLLLLIAFISVVGCKKNKDNGPNNTALVTSSPWYFSSASVDQNNDGIGDVSVPPSVLLQCFTDNFLRFNADGTGILDEGSIKCNATDPQTTPFTWSFTSGEKNINFSASIFPGATGDFKIVTLDSDRLVLSKQITLPGSTTPVMVIITFNH